MNWKNSLFLRVTAVCLTAPFTLAPATASPLHRSTAKESTQQVSRDSPSLELLPLGQRNFRVTGIN